jgi:hypothetical protein
MYLSNTLGDAGDAARAGDQETRILAALGLTHGPFPEVQTEWLERYHEYLAAQLSMPFEAEYAEDISGYRQRVSRVTVISIVHPEQHGSHEEFGLICRAHRGSQEIELPLADVELKESDVNYRLIEDYWYWFWNWRFDPQI